MGSGFIVSRAFFSHMILLSELTSAETTFLHLQQTEAIFFIILLRFSFKIILFRVYKEKGLWLDIVVDSLDTPMVQEEASLLV